ADIEIDRAHVWCGQLRWGIWLLGTGSFADEIIPLDAASKHLLAASMSPCKVATCPL
ncbi:hypothetical protein A2U01_0061697, partial [Trifolium medium]|nr:hypothetical protein [Trifolium medium]